MEYDLLKAQENQSAKSFFMQKKIEKVTQKLEKAFSTKGVNMAACSPKPATRSNDEKDFDQFMLELD